MDVEKLVELIHKAKFSMWGKNGLSNEKAQNSYIADYLVAHGVTMQKHCHKAESVISKTGLMCTVCHSDIDRGAVFCKYCGAKVTPQPPKGE